jgi:uncharacterized membrane protein
MSIAKRIKSYFLRGLAVLLPAVVTIWILVWGYRFIQENISYHINQGLVWLIMRTPFLMSSWPRENLVNFWVEGAGSIAGFIIALIGVLVIGTLLASVVGKTIWRIIEGFITNTPVLRRIYPYVKQVTDFVLTPDEQKQLFSRVVAVEWPRKGVWSIGFVTGSGLTRVVDNVEKEFLTVLIPNTPTPVTGYVVLIPKEETIALDMTVEEAFRFAISAGVVTPVGQRVAALSKADS